MQMACTECGKVGNEDDLCELGEPCPDEGCDGLMVTWQPTPLPHHGVDRIAQYEFDTAARAAIDSLRDNGYAFVDLQVQFGRRHAAGQPGDATRYRIVIARAERHDRGHLWMASSFGILTPLPNTRLHWDYVSSRMLNREHEWTARVLTRFLNTVRYIMEAD